MPNYHQYTKLRIKFHNTGEEVVGYQEIDFGLVRRITDSDGNTINTTFTGPYDSEVIDSSPQLPLWAPEIVLPVEETPDEEVPQEPSDPETQLP